jgi:hypothetical protein
MIRCRHEAGARQEVEPGIMNSICENLRESVAIPWPRFRPELFAEFKVIQSVSK